MLQNNLNDLHLMFWATPGHVWWLRQYKLDPAVEIEDGSQSKSNTHWNKYFMDAEEKLRHSNTEMCH